MNETDKLIEEQFKTLPLNLQQAINAVPWRTIAQNIGKENTLDAEQIISLEQETMFIIYAFEPSEDYIANIVREVSISEDAAYTIAESVADKIFDPISEKSEGMATTPSSVPEIAPEIHPMIEEGEVAHEVPHVEMSNNELGIRNKEEPKPEQPKVSLPDYRYDGKDPYREPLK